MQPEIDEAGNVWDMSVNPPRLIRAAPQQSAPQQPTTTQGTILPAPPPEPQQPPPRTPTGAATEGLPAGYTWVNPSRPDLGVKPIPGYTPKEGEGAKPDQMKLAQFRALEDQIARVEELYRAGPGSTSGLAAIQDYLPSDANASFNSAGAGLSEVALAAFRVPGVGTQSDADLRAFVEANRPSASDRDAAIREKLGNLRRRLNATQEQLGIAPQEDGPNAMTQLRIGAGADAALPGRGDVGTQTIRNPNDIPPELNRDIDEVRARLLSQGGGRLDPQLYAQEVAKIGQKYGFMPEDAAGFAQSLNEYLDSGGTTIPSGVIPPERLMSATETMNNNFANSWMGGALAGAANGIFAGGVDAAAPDQMMAMRDAQPIPMIGGEIGGAIGVTAVGGALARSAAARVAPQLLQGGARGQFARNLAVDVPYGAAYGENTQDAPLTGAALGALGSAAGQGINRGVGAAIGGVRRTPEAIALREQGVPISVARQLGPNAARVEDAMQSIPVVGDMSRARQMESFTGFNEAAMRQAGEPIGFNPTQVGAAGVDDMREAVSNAYGQAVRGVNAPLDDAFIADMRPVAELANGLNRQNKSQFLASINDAMQIPGNAGSMTPQQFQDAVSNLKALRSNAAGAMPNSAQTLRKAASESIKALEGAMRRAGGDEVVDGLNRANAANRGFKTIENASLDRANVGTQAGEANIFTPAQLLQAARAAERKGYGNNPLMDLGRQGQAVLPSSLPNSGSADRGIAAAGLLGVSGAAGGALGYDEQNPVSGAASGAGSGLLGAAAAGGLLALGGRRGSQEALEKLLFQRPEAVRELAEIVRRRGGLLGTAGNVTGQQYGY